MVDPLAAAPRQVLALHCSLAHGGAWAGVAARLPDVVLTAPDLPGHGKAGLWDGRSDLHGDSTRLAILLAEGMPGPVDLVGHSFGATVALRLALERTELVRSLTLIEPVLYAAARAAESPEYRRFVGANQAFDQAVARGEIEAAAQLFMADWGDGTVWQDIPARQRRYILDRIPMVVAQDDVLLQDSAGLLGYMRLEALGIPVLLLEGGNSPPIIAAIQTALAERLPQVTRHVVPGAAHMLPVTHPDAVAKAIAAHLARN